MLPDGSMPGPLICSSRERDPGINLNLRKLHLLRNKETQKGGEIGFRRRVDEGRRRQIIAWHKERERKGFKTTVLIAGTMESQADGGMIFESFTLHLTKQ